MTLSLSPLEAGRGELGGTSPSPTKIWLGPSPLRKRGTKLGLETNACVVSILPLSLRGRRRRPKQSPRLCGNGLRDCFVAWPLIITPRNDKGGLLRYNCFLKRSSQGPNSIWFLLAHPNYPPLQYWYQLVPGAYRLFPWLFSRIQRLLLFHFLALQKLIHHELAKSFWY